jgi:cytochrome c peroxidase
MKFKACCILLLCVEPVMGQRVDLRAERRSTGDGLLAPLPDAIPAPEGNPTTPDKIALGKQLFFDPRLSGDNKMSCASCHVPERAFADGRPTAQGHDDKPLARNTPSLLNVAFQSTFFWDGRAKTLEEQALIPVQSPEEMGQDLDELETELAAIPGYAEQFRSVFGTMVTKETVGQALAAFERTLMSEPSPFDRYLKGEEDALSYDAQRGLELFRGEAGCVRCHHGPLLADGEFHRLGVASADRGRAAVTDKPDDQGKFRTPSLRNVAETAPYMHNGSQRSLHQVVEFYLRGAPTSAAGLPLDVEPVLGLSYSDVDALVAFLESLTGEGPEMTRPELP